MKIDPTITRRLLEAFDFQTLFREQLGWDNHQAQLDLPIDGATIRLAAVAQKRGFVAYLCPKIPDRATRLKIDRQVTKSAHEHLIIYTDQHEGRQVWQWVRREPGRPSANREHSFHVDQSGDALIHRLDQIAVVLDEEEKITVVDVARRARAAFDVEKVTKRFYDRFKDEHAAFMKFIAGIKAGADLQWYASLMLNRLMFVYFIQKKGFLDGDVDYLRNRLAMVRKAHGSGKFQSFYRYFLLRLFHDGLGKAAAERKLDPEMEKLLGKIPYLNGGFFEVHQLEVRNPDIDIPDQAFEKLFDFFDQYSWHLDERPLRADNEINPDVVGYIFEKYINQKQMGAYYTKEDITEYISKNTIIPFLFDAAEKKCAIAFKPDSALWRLLRDDPDRYIYPAVKHGVVHGSGEVVPESDLPDFVQTGMHDANARMFDKRYNLQQAPKDDSTRLVTETWREYVARRTRCLEIREKLRRGEVHQINDLITLNLDIWQFARDAIVNCEGPELLRAFWQAIENLTVLDPTCGSGAFLFAALRILETLYSDCLERMERFAEDLAGKKHPPEQYSDFKKILAQIGQHPNDRYFILKSIIINNLFGVDIMEEAVEICKLRLFLKLAAQVETADQIEPLPDIDFNIRAGNTLVGYATLESLKKGQEGKLLFSAGELAEIEREALGADRIFSQFRRQQTSVETCGPGEIAKTKAAMRGALSRLADRLDQYLAGEYGIDAASKPAEFQKWRTSHQPFHWFVEFYGIVAAGGFDVIIGNPPYLDLRGFGAYSFIGYSTLPTRNLYPLVLERCGAISRHGRQGFIVPASSIATEGYCPLQRFLSHRSLHVSSYDDRPSHLFHGLDKNTLSILLIRAASDQSTTHSTRLSRWSSDGRRALFQLLEYAETPRGELPGCVPKIGNQLEASIWQKIFARKKRLLDAFSARGRCEVYYSRKVNAFIQVLDFVPEVRDGKGKLRPPSEFKTLLFDEPEEAWTVLCLLNATLFRWFLDIVSDGSHLNRREIDNFPFLPADAAAQSPALKRFGQALSKSLGGTSEVRAMRYKHDSLTVQCIIPKHAKEIIDEIDLSLGEHYGFTAEEADYVINYDIKYRMGAESEGEDDE